MTIRIKFILFIAMLFVASISNALMTLQLESQADEKAAWVSHTHNVLSTADKMLSGLTDAETGQSFNPKQPLFRTLLLRCKRGKSEFFAFKKPDL